jgi:hypothetical protein
MVLHDPKPHEPELNRKSYPPKFAEVTEGRRNKNSFSVNSPPRINSPLWKRSGVGAFGSIRWEIFTKIQLFRREGICHGN